MIFEGQKANPVARAETEQYLPDSGGDRRAEEEKDCRSVHLPPVRRRDKRIECFFDCARM
jgi:hypothetical protein